MATNSKTLITTTLSKVDSVRVRPTTRMDGHQVKRVDDLQKTSINAQRMGGERPTPEETLEKLPHENRQMYRERLRQMRKSRKVKA